MTRQDDSGMPASEGEGSDSDEERAESDWLLARDLDPAAPAPTPEIEEAYARLASLLASDPIEPDRDGWQEAALAAMRAEPAAASAIAAPGPVVPARGPRSYRPHWQRYALAAGAMAAAGLGLYLVVRPAKVAQDDQLAIAIVRADRPRGDSIVDPDGSKALVGDRRILTMRPRGDTELRVYQGPRTIVLRCPGAPGCGMNDREWKVDVALSAPVPHYIVVVDGAVQAPATATLDEYLAAARSVRARVRTQQTIDVR
jgi:hypothetical protein